VVVVVVVVVVVYKVARLGNVALDIANVYIYIHAYAFMRKEGKRE